MNLMLKDFGLSDILLALLIIYNAGLSSCMPEITQGPESQTVNPLDSVTLTCLVQDKSEEYIVAWIRDGVRITRNNNESLDSQHVDTSRYALNGIWASGDFSLTIQSVTTRDAGTYQCVVSSASGVLQQESTEATLTVEYQPDLASFQCSPAPAVVANLRINYTVTFRCQSDVGNPPASLTATYDGAIINATNEDTPFQKKLSYVKTIGIEDNGKVFGCKLSQELLEQPKFRSLGPLVVKYPPMDIDITTDPEKVLPTSTSEVIMVSVDTISVIFTCSVTANPEAIFTWTVKEAQGCSKGEHHSPTGDYLVITKTTMAYDGAVITCTANNSIGQVLKKSITIDVINDDDPNALCYSTPKPDPQDTAPPPTKAPVTEPASLTTMHIIIIIIAAAFLIVIIILAYIAFSRRREPPIQLTMMGGGEDTRSIAESIIFHSRNPTPLPEHRSNSLARMQSNFSTMSYDTQSIDSATALMHLRSMESPEYKANPKLTGSPTRKLGGKCGKEIQVDDMDKSPFHRVQSTENTYEGSPKRGSPPPPSEKSALSRQPSEHKYEECPPLKKYTTHASQTDLAFTDDMLVEEREEISDSSDTDDDFDYSPKKQNFSVNNCNIRFAKHTEV